MYPKAVEVDGEGHTVVAAYHLSGTNVEVPGLADKFTTDGTDGAIVSYDAVRVLAGGGARGAADVTELEFSLALCRRLAQPAGSFGPWFRTDMAPLTPSWTS